MGRFLDIKSSENRVKDIEVFNPERVKFIWHDLRAPISNIVDKQIGKIDYVIHMAAESHVDRSLEDSIPFVMSNVVGTANLLEYLKKNHKKCRIIIFSTDEVFGPAPPGVYFGEDSIHRPSNPYAASKSGEEMIAYSFAHAFDLDIAIVRSMNIIGERQHIEKFVPKTIRAILSGEKVIIHGKNREELSSRCWIHARNVAWGLNFLLDRFEKKQSYNIVGEEKTVLEIADWISEVINKRKLKNSEIKFIDYHLARPGHDKRYAMSGEKIKKMGWLPPINLEDSLKKTVKWSIENKKWLGL
jgi:dTDP-glucose 4,6-dehydratase